MNVEIVDKGEISVAIFPSKYSDCVRGLLSLLEMPEFTPRNLAHIKLIKFEKWDKMASYHSPLLNKVLDVREACRVLENSPFPHFRASLKECRDFVSGDTTIAIPRGFLSIIREIGVEFEEV